MFEVLNLRVMLPNSSYTPRFALQNMWAPRFGQRLLLDITQSPMCETETEIQITLTKLYQISKLFNVSSIVGSEMNEGKTDS